MFYSGLLPNFSFFHFSIVTIIITIKSYIYMSCIVTVVGHVWSASFDGHITLRELPALPSSQPKRLPVYVCVRACSWVALCFAELTAHLHHGFIMRHVDTLIKLNDLCSYMEMCEGLWAWSYTQVLVSLIAFIKLNNLIGDEYVCASASGVVRNTNNIWYVYI